MNTELSLYDMELIIEALAVQYKNKTDASDKKLIAITAKRVVEMRAEQIAMLQKVYA
jgi:hypothetical protein